jgi:hypothetical protein
MQATTGFHDGITNPILQQADFVFYDPVAFHPANGVFTPHSGGGNAPIALLLRWGQFPARWSFLGLEDGDARQAKTLEALILIQAAARWQGITLFLCQTLIGGFAFSGIAQEADLARLRNHKEVFERVTLLLATVVFLLRFGIERALNRTFGAIMPKRGVVELLSVSNMSANSAAVRAGSSSWLAKA